MNYELERIRKEVDVTYIEMEGRAIAEAISHWFPITAARVRVQIRSFGICDRRSGTGAGFLLSTSISPANSHSTNCSKIIIYHPGLVQ
jgi:hypothetical protein